MQSNKSQSIECPSHLVYVTDEDPGLTRILQGEKVLYVDEEGNEVSDQNDIKRIEELVIPPNWEDTWICKLENGHLQCTGRDMEQRKQYLYHPDWLAYRQKSKFQRLEEFGAHLPAMRKKIKASIGQDGYPKSKILAIAVKLLDLHYLRIGNDFYASENETYGLTTLRRKHLEVNRDTLELSYKGKSNKYRNITIEDEQLVELIKEINELPGYEVFRYKEGGEKHRIDSADVNEYIRSLSDEKFSAKDFRTWGGTVNALEVFKEAKKEIESNPQKKLETEIVRRVAEILGNTVDTAREYYIHPKVLSFLTEEKKLDFEIKKKAFLSENEAKVLAILEAQ